MIIKIIILALVAILVNTAGNFTITLGSNNINTLTTYTWNFILTASSNRTYLYLIFDTQVTIPPVPVVQYNSNNLSASYINSSTIQILGNSSIFNGAFSLVVWNVKNPPSALKTINFTMNSYVQSGVTFQSGENVAYAGGTLTTCSWSFSLCAQQPNSQLTIQFTILNPLIVGANKMVVNYTSWPYLSNYQLKGSSSLICRFGFDGISFNNATDCIFSANSIVLTYNWSGNISSGTILYFKLAGVNSPSTRETTPTTSYNVMTTDSNFNYIDRSTTGCQINPVCVLTNSNGIFQNTSILTVNSQYITPYLIYNYTPRVTVSAGDILEVYYTSLSRLSNFTSVKFWRTGVDTDTLVYSTFSAYYSFAFTQINTNYNSFINFKLNTTLKLPPSQTPATLTFLLKRSNSLYLQLNAQVQASASIILNNMTAFWLSNQQMATPSVTYTFSYITQQPLSNSPIILITFPNDISISSVICSVSIASFTDAFSNCTANSSILRVVFSSGGVVGSGTNITIKVSGITNPFSPNLRYFPFAVYYDTVATSRVQYSDTNFNTVYSAISSFGISLSPSSLQVYKDTPMTISFVSPLQLPINSTFYIQLPSVITQILSPNSTVILNINNNSQALSTGPIINSSNSFYFITSALISINNTVDIMFNIIAPSALGNYPYVRLTVYNSVHFLQSYQTMTINVQTVSVMPVTITSLTPVTGALSSYSIQLTLSIPHQNNFIVQISLPNDTAFNRLNSYCSGNCSTNISANNNSIFSFTAQTSLVNGTILTFIITQFTNARSIGFSLPWTVTTKQLSTSNTISIQSASPQLTLPNILRGMLSQQRGYYRADANPIEILLNFTNSLISGDYILFQISTSLYTVNTTVNCSAVYGACSINANTTGSLVIMFVPNLGTLINNSISLILEGLVSASTISYNTNISLFVTSYNSTAAKIDNGTINYLLSCSFPLALSNQCRSCSSNGTCIDCYVFQGMYLLNNGCVSNCPAFSSNLTYSNTMTGKCQTCINNCQTCLTSLHCLSCISTYYYYPNTNTCQLTCTNTSGYISIGYLCALCFNSPTCLECTSVNSGFCIRCGNGTVLVGGVCVSGCLPHYYASNTGGCNICSQSCMNCTQAGNANCITCASTHYNNSNFCVTACPAGKAIMTNNTCGCASQCLTCDSANYTYCLICFNSSLFSYQGLCIGKCPNNSYNNGGSICLPCPIGCLNCTSTICFNCNSTLFFYNNLCYQNCNNISLQYDSFNTNCVLCPDGCDTCNGSLCLTCMPSYMLSISNQQCIRECLLTNSCDINSSQQTIPLPGCISLVIWGIIVGIIHFLSHKSYLPYSVIFFSSIVQLVLIIVALAIISNTSPTLSRLLLDGTSSSLLKALFGLGIAANYIGNLVYILIFMRYIKPLIPNPRQIDVISNVVVLIVAVLTNYRFAIIAFAKLFPKPNIQIRQNQDLKQLHRLCIVTMCVDVLPLIACIVGMSAETPASNLFMICLDLFLVLLLNIVITIYFITCDKPESYYQYVKKYHTEDGHNPTEDAIPNQKDASKMNVNPNQSLTFDDQFSQSYSHDLKGTYNQLIQEKAKGNRIKNISSIDKKQDDQAMQVVKVGKKSPKMIDSDNIHFEQEQDANFEQRLKSKRSGTSNESANKGDFNMTVKSQGKSVEDNISLKNREVPNNFSKDKINSSMNYRQNKQIEEMPDDQSDVSGVNQASEKDRESIFQTKQKIIRPKRVGADKNNSKKKEQGNPKANIKKDQQKRRNAEQPMKLMKKDKRIGYFESEAYESNGEPEDIEAIIKQKVWQSTVRLDKPRLMGESNEETAYEQISPSWFNVQNQRIDVSDYDQNQSDLSQK